jgi:hypothetical protein
MFQTSTWLTNMAVDKITNKPQEYNALQKVFIDILTVEEQSLSYSPLANIYCKRPRPLVMIEQSWVVRAFWNTLELSS